MKAPKNHLSYIIFPRNSKTKLQKFNVPFYLEYFLKYIFKNYFIYPNTFMVLTLIPFREKVNRFLSILEKLLKSHILERNICGLEKSRKMLYFTFLTS